MFLKTFVWLVLVILCEELLPIITDILHKSPSQLKNLPLSNGPKTLLDPNSIYVDKSSYVLKLLQKNQKYFFFTSPRMFGKTAFLEIMNLIFDGEKNKPLFKGTTIYNDVNYDWKHYPVIRLDFSNMCTIARGTFEEELEDALCRFDKTLPRSTRLEDLLHKLLKKLYDENPVGVVVLVDRYDEPMTNIMADDNSELADENREVARRFFQVLQANEPFIRMVYVTGIIKFAQASIFSVIRPNQFYDLSLDPEFMGITGFTEEELQKNFEDHIRYVAKIRGMSKDDYKKNLRDYYKGYKLTPKTDCKIYNPWSIINCIIKNGTFDDYWFQTGSSYFLYKVIKSLDLQKFENATISEEDLHGASNLRNFNPIATMYHTGYYTIHEYNARTKKYLLSFPNAEVQKSFYKHLAEMNADDAEEEFHSCRDQYILWQVINDVNATNVAENMKIFIAVVDASFTKDPSFNVRLEEGTVEFILIRILHRAGFRNIVQQTVLYVFAETSNTILVIKLVAEKTSIVSAKKHLKNVLHAFSRPSKKVLGIVINISRSGFHTTILDYYWILVNEKNEFLDQNEVKRRFKMPRKTNCTGKLHYRDEQEMQR